VHGVEASAAPAAPEPLGGGDGAVVEPVHQREAGARRRVRHRARRRVVRGEQHHARAASACRNGEGPGSSSSKSRNETEERGGREGGREGGVGEAGVACLRRSRAWAR
jgi:hypothetical protein